MSPGGRSRFGALVLALAVSATCVALGMWQGRRLAARRAANQAALTARSLPEADLNQDVLNQALPNRRVVARGSFDHEHSFVLRGRVERETPGVQLVVPLRLEGRTEAVLVNRGFVPAADAARPDPAGIDRVVEVTARGLALPIPTSSDSGAPLLVHGGQTTWRRLDAAAIRNRLPYPVLDVYLHETDPEPRAEGSPRWPAPAALPPLDDGPHFSYMLQWFGIAVVALVFGITFARRGRDVEESRRESKAVKEGSSEV